MIALFITQQEKYIRIRIVLKVFLAKIRICNLPDFKAYSGTRVIEYACGRRYQVFGCIFPRFVIISIYFPRSLLDKIGLLVVGMKKDRLVIYQISHEKFMMFQISRIDGCNIKRIGNLEFDFWWGACNTYQFDVEKILFCFGPSESQCHL